MGCPVCKYLYRGSACAHHRVEVPECVGFDQCSHFLPLGSQLTGTASGALSGASHRWLGLYCEAHQRFECETHGPCRPAGLRPPISGGFSGP